MLIKNTVKSCVFSRTGESSFYTVLQVITKCHDSLYAGQSVSSANHSDLNHPIAHPKGFVGDIVSDNDLQTVQSSPQVISAKGSTPGFESTVPGFESSTAGFESVGPEIEHSGSGFEPGDVNLVNPVGSGLDSPQGTDVTLPVDGNELAKGGKQVTCLENGPHVNVVHNVGSGFDSCAEASNSHHTSVPSMMLKCTYAKKVCQYHYSFQIRVTKTLQKWEYSHFQTVTTPS